ncbi:hypothetical protein GCM10011409_37890 [Lentibacillus populi]|uniref:Uncharacterized protein n=1 Tax=Lentibacillus populi TaxID=1827502 RepID=A0A9W5U1U0_9BACI|nr:hypothetical protein GCM10011409_37890 [Lentibacillus populi]
MQLKHFNYITVLLIILQVTEVIDISWWFVFTPTLIFFVLSYIVLYIYFYADKKLEGK